MNSLPLKKGNSKPSLKAVPKDFQERFEFLALLGRGNFGEVFRVRDKVDQAEYALKLQLPASLKDVSVQARFQREIEVTSKLSSPYIVKLFEGGVCEGRSFLLLEYCLLYTSPSPRD